MSAPVFVRLGLSTPLGLRARASQCAVAAGLTAFSETEVLDVAGHPVRAAFLRSLDPGLAREERMLFFGERAIAECLSGIDPRGRTAIPCYVALPEPDSRPFDEARVMRGLASAAGGDLPLDWSARPIREGRAGVFAALSAAAAVIASGRAALALVGGVDSSCDRGSLEHLAKAERNLGKVNPDGLIPGEGAGFVLLARGGTSGFGAPLGRLVACATARDALPFGERNPMKAVGLTALFKQLRAANAGQPRPQHLYSCQTGESFWARELNNAYLRNAEVMPEPFRTSIIAATLGDAGAASAVVQMGIGSHAFATAHRSGTPVDKALIYGSSDGISAGGCIVAR
jgi:3-oxoacyl-[acyl-carrier-protein] synthase I